MRFDRDPCNGAGVRRTIAVLALVAAAVGCGSGGARPTPPPAAARPEMVVERGRFESNLLLTGELAAVRSAKIVIPRTPAWRVAIRWMEADGAEVLAGQKVLELDNSQFAGDLEQNRLAESRALNELMRKEADIAVERADKRLALERARIELEKARLRADVPPDLLARRDYQERQLALARAEVGWEKAREDLSASQRAAEAELEERRLAVEQARERVRVAEQAIAALTLHAPGDGILVVAENRREGRKYQIGDPVWVGLAVMSIPDLSAMQVEATLSDVDDGKIEPGLRALCVLDSIPGRTFPGRVVEISPIATEQRRGSLRRAFDVTVALETTDPQRMLPGMSVRVEVLRPAADEEALLVPRAAVDFAATSPHVLLADGSTTPVRLGPCDAMRCVVENGLREGQRLRRRS